MLAGVHTLILFLGYTEGNIFPCISFIVGGHFPPRINSDELRCDLCVGT